MTHMAQGVGSGMGAGKGQGWAHSRLVWVSMLMFVLWALSVSWVHAKPKALPSPLPQVTQLGQGTLVLKQGASGVLQATLSPTPTAPGVLAVSSDAPATVSVPTTITFAAGQTQVGIPVTGEHKGKADITVSLNGSSRSAKVNVTPAPSRLLSLLPAQATLQPGATLVLQVSLTPRKPGGPITLQLSSSDLAKVYVPASITLTEGQSTASFEARAMSTGSATITARITQGGTNSIATAQIQVVPPEQGPLAVVSLAPPTSSIEQGAQTTLTLTLSAAASTPTTVALQARTPGVLSLPTQVVVPTGQRSASFPVQGLATGQTLVVASLGTSSTEAAVQVTPVPARVASIEPTQTQLTVNAQATLTARLNAAQPSDTRVALSTQPPGVAQVPAELLVPTGQTQATLSVTALAVGQAEVVASLNGSTQRAGITVTPEPVTVAAMLPQPLGIQAGASGALTVRLSAAPSDAVVVTLTSSNTAVAQLPGSVSFAPGTIEQSVVVTGVQAGSSQITAVLGASSASTTVQVSTPPPRLAKIEPPVLDLPKGQLGQLTLTLDRAPLAPTVITVQNSNPAALQVPDQVTVAAGQLSTVLSLVSLQQGSAQITASLNNGSGSSSLQATVNVVPPQIVAITVTPPTASLGAGQSLQLQAQGTYTDASTRTITTDPATLWKSEGSGTAAVTSTGPTAGLVTGQQPGQTRITAEQTPAALQGQGTPQTVQGSAAVVVSDAGALSLTASRTALTVGETVPVVLALPYPVNQGVTVNLAATPGLQVPASLTIPAGETSRTFNAQATAIGSPVLSASPASTNTGFEPAQLAFSISAAVPTGPVIGSVAPNAGAPGTPVTLSGSGFSATPGGNTVVFTGNAPAVVQSASATQLVVTVPATAQTGPISVTTTAGTGTSPVFTVQRDQAFDLQSSPAQFSVMQGSQASAVITLASSGVRPYEGLARLSITGLPAGVTARFEPAQISAQQSGQLILSAADSAALGSSTLTLQASATLDGLPWVRQSQITAQVITRANVTGVKGRFVTPQGQGIAGIIVRHENSTSNQVVTDAAGNFLITSLPSGVSTLRFDATPAHALYPIWPYSVTLQAGEVLTLADWTINPPPADDKFVQIANAASEQRVADPRYPGFEVVLPAGVSITGWDGVKKTRIAVQRIEPNQLPVASPPFAMKEAYQLYFGTPMGGIPSAPIPVTLPNVADKEPGEKVDIWFFDGSPMGGTGEWKKAGQGTVSADGKTVTSDPGAGLTRFCGVCGLVSLSCPPVPTPVDTALSCPAKASGNPVELFSGTELASANGPSCGGLTPISTGIRHNPVDAFNNRAGTLTSLGYGWTFEHDVSFLPFAGPQKRLVMPGGQLINYIDDGSGKYRPGDDPRHAGSYAQAGTGGAWDVIRKDGTTWHFEPFAGIGGLIRGGPPLFLTRITDPSGNSTTLTRQSNGRLQSVQGLDGRRINLSYGANGFANEITDHTGRTQAIEYTATANPRISALVDPAGRRTEYSYQSAPVYRNGAGPAACEAELPAGEPQYIHRIQYPGSNTPTVNTIATDRVVKQTTSTGETWKFAYKRIGACVVKVQDEATKTWAYSCRAGQSLSSRTLPAGATATETLSGTCPEVESEETINQGWRFFGGTNVQTTVTHPNGSTTTTRFNPRGLPLEETDEAGQTTRHQYDANNQKTKTTDPLGRVTSFEYDTQGNQTAMTNPLGIRTETAFEPVRNKPTSLTQYLLGVPSQQGGLQLSYTPVSQSMTYDAKGNLTQVLDATGISGQMGYDAKGQLSSITLPAKATASTLPTVNEGTAGSIAKTARQIALSYNAAGDLAKITDALNNATNLGTDSLGRTTSSTDPLGYTSTQQYNQLDQPTDAKNPLNHTTRFIYDAAGRTTGVINEAGVTIESYTHDSQGRVIRVTDALQQQTNIEYDSSNRPNKITDRKGQVTQISYTERGQISSISQTGQTIQYQYDAVGRLTEVRDNTSVNQYQYDAADRVTQIVSTTAAGSHRLGYEYDSLDRTTKRSLSGTGITTAEATTYAWDLAGRLLSHTTNIGSTSHKTEYEYDQAGRLAARHAQAGTSGKLTQRYGYDQAERLAQIKYLRNEGQAGEQLIEQIDYSYDAKGQRTAKTTLNNHGAGGSETPMTATYDAANRMSAVTLTIGGTSKSYMLTHDANGNLTTKQNTADSQDKTTYTWDSNNRLTQITQPGLTASFSYDAFGRRIQSSIAKGGSTSTVQYLYEGLQSLGEIRDGKLSHRLLTGLSLDETIARMAINTSGNKDQANSRVYMTDALNSVIAQLNDEDSASVANSYAYSPYGESQTIGPDASNNPIQYTSREDDGTGLLYYRARYYDTVLKGFISRDPIGQNGGPNEFSYVKGNPQSFVDPDGRIPLPIITGAIGAVAGFGGSVIGQLISNGGKTGCISWKNAFIAGGVGAAAGALAPFAATSYLGAAALGAGSNTVQYGITQYANGESVTALGAAWSVGTGALGGLIGGRIKQPSLPWDENSPWANAALSRALNQDEQAAINTGIGNFARNLGGSTTGSIDPPGSGSSCGCP